MVFLCNSSNKKKGCKILIIHQMMCKKRGKRKERKNTTGKTSPSSLCYGPATNKWRITRQDKFY
jgi:hypothetical protein